MTNATPWLSLDPSARQRAAVLRQLDLLNSSSEAAFDELVELAASICGKPLGAMTLLDEKTQHMKARIGLRGSRTMPVRDSICQYTVRGTGLLMVEDVGSDPRFQNNATLEADPGIRFYAGMPLVSEKGCALGALCVMDTEPSTLNPQQQRALEILAHQMSAQIQLRERAFAMECMAQERERGQRLFDVILNHVPVGIYLKDSDGRIRFYNESIARRFGIDREEWLGKTSYDLWDLPTAEQIMAEDSAVLESGQAHVSTVTLPSPQGTPCHWKSYKVPCESMEGDRLLACCSVDLTSEIQRETALQNIQEELKEANSKLSSLALTDALTGLWNRRAFDARLETSIIGAQRSRQPMALMLIDADHFKRINDLYGHPYGDTVLKSISAILNRVKRADEIACRYGGEEFAVLMPGNEIGAAKALADRLMAAMHAFPWEKEPVTVSIGLAMCTADCTADDLVDDADAALYQAKREGRNRSVVHGCAI